MIVQRLTEVRQQLVSATREAGRNESEVELLVVSKTFPASTVSEVVSAGENCLGENRVQEALEKQLQLPSSIDWHLIGPLQRNKVRKVVGKFSCLQGIDSLKLARAIDRVAEEVGIVQPVLLQVKTGREETKSGFEAEVLQAEIDELVQLASLRIDGLMTIPPPTSQSAEARRYFSNLRELRDSLSTRSGLPLSQLSMGMSGDYQAAIAEGSTMVRVGSAIFGKRD